MNTVEPKLLKGFRDFLPQTAVKRQYIINIIKDLFHIFGFEPLETPTLEYEEILLGKYGDEGDQLMYRFEDLGKRKVAMRYDKTVPLARVIAQYQDEIPLPFKRYQIQTVFRAENTQKGRFREFLQCDADIVGSVSPLADAEVLALVFTIFQKLGIRIVIKMNDRALLKTIPSRALPIPDKLNKVGEENVLKEMQEKGFSQDDASSILKDIKSLKASVYLKEIHEIYTRMGLAKESLQFEATLVRGLNYYTGLIFAIGFDRTFQVLEDLHLFPDSLTATQVLITIFSSEYKNNSLEITARLRKQNIAAELYLDENVPMNKQMKYAAQKGIPFVIIVGPEEAEKGLISLRNMKNHTQKHISLDTISAEIS